ncbi:hypothetical protein M2164_005786 [Streptomyces sp. SAI-208]|uniref:hypothetical protein n=1 Tax=unclassified Streptomyces TaxID=2593676 RepID=UPI002474DF49|nr:MULTISPECIES: hypothetical protein [unclassified Streptomyces]MDH6519308.1 hypothetical protein [Streptomyces sp. SAI-090]MDH6551532.1 hypothetical protein [Streptomyces sp. SAI-041]MDH6570612.1 hypothetical protein [Streptomyces sp. SAI-117]MDH6584412.1 hypothetical protein [Streptomyces sp. SAI-133]MDH6610151.1 hypothetical protein [Streptomyces sp. SAI-208]
MTSASPGPSRLTDTVDALRTALAQSPDVLSFTLGGTIDEETAAAAEADGVPREFLDFCRVLDGASCGPNVQLFGLAEAEEHQFYCGPVADSPLPLSPEKLFCVGMVNEAPLFLDRAGGGVLGAPAAGPDWVDAERFEQLAPGVEAFFLDRLATAEYARLAEIDDELLEYDDWLKLLRRAGLTD